MSHALQNECPSVRLSDNSLRNGLSTQGLQAVRFVFASVFVKELQYRAELEKI